MTLSMRRIVLFTKDMPGMVSFYRDVLVLKLRKDEKGWKEIDANGCVIALHNGTSEVGRRPPVIISAIGWEFRTRQGTACTRATHP